MIEFDTVTKTYPRRHHRRGWALRSQPRRGRSRCSSTPRVRQDDVAADDQPDDRPDLGSDPRRRPGHREDRPGHAAARHRLRHPARRLFPHRTIVDKHLDGAALLGWDKKKARDRSMELMERVGLDNLDAGRYPALSPAPAAARRASPARSRPIRRSCSWTSRSAPSTRSCASSSDDSCACRRARQEPSSSVTHDIDEAIKLGDQVAVLRVGGKLAQLAPPADCSPSRPTTSSPTSSDGTAHRSLGFRRGELTLSPSRRCRSGPRRPGPRPRRVLGLVVDEHDKPPGWVEPHRVDGSVRRERLHRGGTVASVDGSLRAALDAALSSPAGRASSVDGDGRLLGTVLPREVLTLIEAESGHGASTPLAQDVR